MTSMKNIKIAISGTFSTGKTTLARALGKEFGMAVIDEQFRKLCEVEGVSSMDEFRSEHEKFQAMLKRARDAHIREENDKRIENKGYVSDTFILDNYAYDIMNVWGGLENWLTVYGSMETAKSLFSGIGDNYDYVVYLYPTIEIKDDEFRNLDKRYRKRIDNIIKHLLCYLNPDKTVLIKLDENTLEERVAKIKKLVKPNE